MSEKPFPEKTEEMLFTRYFLQACGLGNITLYAPSSIEEGVEGYDAKLFGAHAFQELFLQFKSPVYKKREHLFRVDITPHQHEILQGLYKPGHAFYVTHVFRSLDELHEVERNMQQASEFLLHFIAIQVSGLPSDAKFFTYKKPLSHHASPDVKYGDAKDRGKHEGSTPLPKHQWLRCSKLLRDFREDKIGRWVELIVDDASLVPFTESCISGEADGRQHADTWRVSPTIIRKIMHGDRDRDRSFGVMYRKDLSWGGA